MCLGGLGLAWHGQLLWKVEQGAFSITLPGKPDYSTEMNPAWPSECRTHSYTCSTAFRAYVASYALMPRDLRNAVTKALEEDPKGEDVRYVLNEVVHGLTQAAPGAKITEDQFLMTQGFPTRKVKIEMPNGMTLYAMALVTQDRLYTLAMANPKSVDNPEAAKGYFDSLKLDTGGITTAHPVDPIGN